MPKHAGLGVWMKREIRSWLLADARSNSSRGETRDDESDGFGGRILASNVDRFRNDENERCTASISSRPALIVNERLDAQVGNSASDERKLRCNTEGVIDRIGILESSASPRASKFKH